MGIAIRFLVASVLPLVFVATGGSEELPRDSAAKDRMTASIHYEDLMLILSDRQGVAAVTFTEEIKDGVGYRYRYLSKDGKKKSEGTGKVFGKYKRLPGQKPNETMLVDDGGQLYIKAGSVLVEWSYAGKGKGCLYYRPERLHVEIALAKDFKPVDLRRFFR